MHLLLNIRRIFGRVQSLFLIASTVSALLSTFSLVFTDPVLGQGETDENFKNTLNNGLKCTDLLLGQYLCAEPVIDPETQQPIGCSKDKKYVNVLCKSAPGIVCDGQFNNDSFYRTVPCKWTSGHSFETALLLSVFLGMFGVDRFYLGYPAIGLLKFATLGFMFLGQLIDILLIATQVLTPSDGSAYVLDYYGAAVVRIFKDNETYLFTED
ncbi:unnamed protein product [Lymnaea stagnalis]|uniref:TM2 domain-containing protein n=1 Tax=Lymnaea stagnalis TaxID=6523 RepID=A0AAV2IDX7_LYMST